MYVVSNNKLIRVFSLVGLSVVLIVLFYFIGCNNKTDEISTELGQEVELGIGQTVVIEDEPIKLKFIEVAGDSRCPIGNKCVWAGEVTYVLEITYLDELYTVSITQPGDTPQKSMEVFHKYEIYFNVEPYPELDKEIKDDEYRLQLVIDRNPRLTSGILVTFDVEGEIYNIFVENEATIADILAVEKGESQAMIPSGKIIGEPMFYNESWSWHIDPVDIHMAEFTIEVCSGLPSHVEEDLDYWVNTVGRFCPWSAEIVAIKDFR